MFDFEKGTKVFKVFEFSNWKLRALKGCLLKSVEFLNCETVKAYINVNNFSQICNRYQKVPCQNLKFQI